MISEKGPTFIVWRSKYKHYIGIVFGAVIEYMDNRLESLLWKSNVYSIMRCNIKNPSKQSRNSFCTVPPSNKLELIHERPAIKKASNIIIRNPAPALSLAPITITLTSSVPGLLLNTPTPRFPTPIPLVAFVNGACVGIRASRTVNPVQLGSVAITDNQSWVFSRHCTGGKVVLRMANKLTGGGNGRIDKYGP